MRKHNIIFDKHIGMFDNDTIFNNANIDGIKHIHKIILDKHLCMFDNGTIFNNANINGIK